MSTLKLTQTFGNARRQGVYKGRTVYCVPVGVFKGGRLRYVVEVLAESAGDACNEVISDLRKVLGVDCVGWDVEARGPKGGKAYRYSGWYTAIGAALDNDRAARGVKQLELPKVGEPPVHVADTQCSPDAEGICACGAYHGDPCSQCGQCAYHALDCPTMGPETREQEKAARLAYALPPSPVAMRDWDAYNGVDAEMERRAFR